MPKLGMEPIRRAALIDAAIAEIGEAGSLDVTVSRIARRAGVSSALAHHYFGGKDDILLAAMRRIMKDYAAEVLARLMKARTPMDRVRAVIDGSFASSSFDAATISAWLNFYVLSLSSEDARRLHRIYAGRLRSNLTCALRPLAGSRAPEIARRTAQLIDGAYLHHGLRSERPDGGSAARDVLAMVEAEIRER
ncbi:MAG: transcriptional regulator BetI [Paracoccaceae bacterium]|nr:transcriptional regulator BetI [Paracoccaceae bacterium]